MAYLKCKSCRHKEETSLKFFVRVIGAVLAFQDEIIEWLADKGYKCEKCGKSSFVMSKN
ncbi:hypothetical protein [Helicobacter pylori]|uniref:hypothetical protein n=1 Tax=Helicobacter pylori TaxID=210 RepID=UPI001AA75701|nr:hypothetical protein [Helicobacter pylori]WJI96534.1 hypothetical protein QAP00_05485 [Helicobacter pylori]GHR49836.1 hypothetical protein VN1263_00840 [Helicobacter pylori]